MAARAVTHFQPRKTPVQTRAAVTVGAISEATIQILLKEGAHRLTTTRVAERAGVSVGTLYQYYPNKQSLLFAVLGAHLDSVATAVEAACEPARRKPLREMIRAVVGAFVDAKMQRIDGPEHAAMLRNLRPHLVVLCQSYISAQCAARR
jgi:AcrR family transcriptional regulator